MQMKRWLFEIHRWVGIVLALFMLLWFFSGLVIIYAEPTTPTRAQQLAHAESLTPSANWLSAGEAWERSAVQRKELAAGRKSAEDKKPADTGAKKSANSAEAQVVEARLLLQADEPLWLIEDSKGQRLALSAVLGSLHKTTAEQAQRIAEKWVSHDNVSAAAVKFVETIDKPAIVRNQEALRPFHRIAVDDGAGSELFV